MAVFLKSYFSWNVLVRISQRNRTNRTYVVTQNGIYYEELTHIVTKLKMSCGLLTRHKLEAQKTIGEILVQA